MMIAGTWKPTSDTVGPRAAVSVYAGAMHEMPMTTAPMRPTVPALSPLVESPVGAPFSADGGEWRRGAHVIAHRDSPSEARVRGTTIMGTGSS